MTAQIGAITVYCHEDQDHTAGEQDESTPFAEWRLAVSPLT
jgi:hypothetical protein